jgi:hypothetical protein
LKRLDVLPDAFLSAIAAILGQFRIARAAGSVARNAGLPGAPQEKFSNKQKTLFEMCHEIRIRRVNDIDC